MTATTLAAPKQDTKNPRPTALKHKAKRKWTMPLIVASVLVAGGGWWVWSATHPADNGANSLITATVNRGDLIETVSATGSITAQTGAQVKIGSQITGRIKKLNADVGSQVKAGQVIAELDLPDIQAQLNQAKANLAVARTKAAQQQSGVIMQQTQTSGAIVQAKAGQASARARLHSAQATVNQQLAQTPTDIDRAINSVASAQAALNTAKSNMIQTQAGADLQVANAQQQVNQTQATAHNSDLNLTRQQALLTRGFVAASIVDQAQATDSVNQSLILASQQSVILVQQKNTADLQSGQDLITQAVQNVKTAQSALAAARSETFLDAVKQADVGDARASLGQANAALTIATGNTSQNILKQQDVLQAQEAIRVAVAQVAYAQAQADKTIIRSPISGTVLQLASQQGETLAAGLSSPTLIVVADLTRLQVDTYVDETDIGKVQIGQSATVTVDAFTNKKFTGRVTKIASGSTIQSGVITYDVTVALDSPERQLKPDMTASVTMQTGKLSAVLLLPSEAVKTSTHGTTVTVLTATKGKAATTEVRKVTTGGTDGVNTEIRDGLKEGETVVLAGTLKVTAAKKTSSPFGMGGRGGGRPSGGGGPP